MLAGMVRLAVLGLVVLTACSSGGGATEHRGEPAAVPVRVAEVTRQDAPVELHAVGTVEPVSSVAVRSRVEGQLSRVAFSEGQTVHRDDVLFVIDERPFQTALRQAEANLARDRAEAERARVEADRFGRLLAEGVVSRDETDRSRTQAETARAAVAAGEAAVERARLDLGYCTIRSPLDGRVGQLLVHQGNLVKTNDTTLAVINQLQPIHVSFAVPEEQLPAVRRHMAGAALPVQATSRDGTQRAVGGELVFVNNTVDQATGTVLLKGAFANGEEELWPGQFVDVALRLTTERDALVIPSAAVQTGQEGAYVFVVRGDGTVESRPVVIRQRFDEHVVVEKGVAAGERVVTEGQLRLAPGVRVEARDGASTG
ncbi:MAG TPA: efflux RND transporter periplasmic adaptor subunit [Candidatus Binatia bacterium]|nr:efflux RND transporter periplasmic adaptor subunit [Candidatus Binatia bacterium]